MTRVNKITTLTLIAAMCLSMAACTKENSGITETEAQSTEMESVAYRNDISVAELEKAVSDALGDNYYPQEAMPSLENLEITEDMYDEFIYKVPMISVNVDTLIIVKAKEGRLDDVEAKLNAYRDMNINNTMQYPMNLSKIQCSEVAVIGDYAVFVQLGAGTGEEAVEAAGGTALSEDEAAKIEMEAITNQNDMAIKAIEEVLKNN